MPALDKAQRIWFNNAVTCLNDPPCATNLHPTISQLCPKCPPAAPAAPVDACKPSSTENYGQRSATVATVADNTALNACTTQLQWCTTGWTACNVTVANLNLSLSGLSDISAAKDSCEADLGSVRSELAERGREIDNTKALVLVYEQASEANHTGWASCNSTLEQALADNATCHGALGQLQASVGLASGRHGEELAAKSSRHEEALAVAFGQLIDCNTTLNQVLQDNFTCHEELDQLKASAQLASGQHDGVLFPQSAELTACLKNLEGSNRSFATSTAALELCEKNRTGLLYALQLRDRNFIGSSRPTGSRSKSMTSQIKARPVRVMAGQGVVERGEVAQEPVAAVVRESVVAVVASNQTLVQAEAPKFELRNHTVCPAVNESAEMLALRAQVANLTRDLKKHQVTSPDVRNDNESDKANEHSSLGLWQQLVGYLSQIPSYAWAVTGVVMLPANIYVICKIVGGFSARAAKRVLNPQALKSETSGAGGRGDGGDGGRGSDPFGGVPSNPTVYFGGGFGHGSDSALQAVPSAAGSRTVFGLGSAESAVGNVEVSLTAVGGDMSDDNEPASGSEDVGARGIMQDLPLGGRVDGVLLPPPPSADQSPTINPRLFTAAHGAMSAPHPASGGVLRPTGPRASAPIQHVPGFAPGRRRSISEGGTPLIPQSAAYALAAPAYQLHIPAPAVAGVSGASQQADVGHQPAATPPLALGSTRVGRADGSQSPDLRSDGQTQHFAGVNAAMRWVAGPKPPELVDHPEQFSAGDAVSIAAHGPGPVGAMQPAGAGLVGGAGGGDIASAAATDVQGGDVSAASEVGVAGSLPPPPPPAV